MERERPYAEVSIIIPVYNNEAYVQKCIDSVKKQSFEEFEAIIVNDGSTDNSRSIIEALIEKDERFHLINQENQGVAAARNRGIDQAKGKYLTFIDGDDYIGRDYLKNLYETAETAQAQMVICGFCYTGEDGKIIKKVIPGEYKRYEREEWTFRIAATWAHLYLRELWEKYQVRFCWGKEGRICQFPCFLVLCVIKLLRYRTLRIFMCSISARRCIISED